MNTQAALRHFGVIFILTAAIVLLLHPDPGYAQTHMNDTLQVVPTTLEAGDTAWVLIYIANSEVLGGYTVRLIFDTALVEVIRRSPSDPGVPAIQLRGSFTVFRFGNPEPGIVAGVAVSLNLQQRLDIGRGNTIRLPFRIREGVQHSQKTSMAFVDAPFDTNASNWFAVLDGSYQYRPVRVPGVLCLGECRPLSVDCPSDTSVHCGDSTDPSITGFAVPGDPGAAVSYSDDTTGGPCPEGLMITRTWEARLFDEEAHCTQTIAVNRLLPNARLFPNRPNPLLPGSGRETLIDYYIPASGHVTISIYDVVGRCLYTLVDRAHDRGDYTVAWDGRDADGKYVPSGVYLCRLSCNQETQLMKIAVLR